MEVTKRNFEKHLQSTTNQIQVVTMKHQEFTKQLRLTLIYWPTKPVYLHYLQNLKTQHQSGTLLIIPPSFEYDDISAIPRPFEYDDMRTISPPPEFVDSTSVPPQMHVDSVATGKNSSNLEYPTGIDNIKKMNSSFDHTALKKIAGVKVWVEVDSCSSQTMIDEEVFKELCTKLRRNLKLSKPRRKYI